MLPVAPSRLPTSFPLRRALSLAHPGEPLGVWVRAGSRPLRLRAGGRALLAGADLGFLLRRCARIALRHGQVPAVLPAERLIAWRTLQVVTGMPWLTSVPELEELYPGLHLVAARISLPLGMSAAEPALAACAAARVPVRASWIAYAAPSG